MALSTNNNPLHEKLVCEKYEINFCTCFLYKNNQASRSSRPVVFCKKGVLRISQNSQEKTCARVSFLVSSYEFCEISKNTFFHRTPLVAASVYFFFYSMKRSKRQNSVLLKNVFSLYKS